MNILFIGHSLIEFYDWQKRFPEHTAANLGVAGETVEGLLSRTGEITRKHQTADLVFLMSGLNNIAMGDFNFFDSYKKIIEKLLAAYPAAKIFINSIPPVVFEFIPNGSIVTANNSLAKTAYDAGIEFLDIYGLFLNAEGRPVDEYFIPDGVHLSDKGYAVWIKAIEEIINKTA